LIEARGDAVQFDICGSGTALDELRRQARQLRLDSVFHIHGHCDQERMRSMLAACHAVIVPTTTDFPEGFNQVVAEAILAGRPVVTSRVCPAVEYVPEAVVEVPPDDVAAYESAVMRLCDDGDFYESKRRGALNCRSLLLQEELSWGAVLRRVIQAMRAGEPARELRIPCGAGVAAQ
jgi:glycogen synthase